MPVTFDPVAAASTLRRDSVVVIPLGEDTVDPWRKAMWDWIANAPEFTPAKRAKAMDLNADPAERLLGLGGFGAPGVASLSNWNRLRPVGQTVIRDVFDELEPHLGCEHLCYKQGLPDRFKFRPARVKPSQEKGHRDLSSHHEHDVLFASMTNLSTGTIQFSCVLGTHREHSRGAEGFTKLSDDDTAALKAKKILVNIPPGHCCIFYESILHEVLGKPLPFDKLVAFVGYRLTDQDSPLHPGGRQRMIEQRPHNYKAFLPDRDKARPRMFPKIYTVYSRLRDKLTKFATEDLIPAMSEDYTMKTASGGTYRRPKEFAPGLFELGCPQPEWTPAQLDTYAVFRRRGVKRAREL